MSAAPRKSRSVPSSMALLSTRTTRVPRSTGAGKCRMFCFLVTTARSSVGGANRANHAALRSNPRETSKKTAISYHEPRAKLSFGWRAAARA